MLNLFNLNNKYIWAINNTDMDEAKDLGLTSIKKYLKCADQIKKQVNKQ